MGTSQAALEFIKCLGPAAPEMRMVNVVEPLLSDGTFPDLGAGHPMASMVDDLMKAGQAALDRAKADWPNATTHVAMGYTGSVLVGEAASADLLAVGSQHKTLAESFFGGSVARTLAIESKVPVLIAKAKPVQGSGMTAVVSHDLSDQSTLALQRLSDWALPGVRRVVLVTALDPGLSDPESTRAEHAKWTEKWAPWCGHVESVIEAGTPTNVINKAMSEFGGELLVMGARGHGFLERMFIGSVALHMVVREPHNLLLMRSV